MKKLMIAAATAAMVGGAFADAQVWEMSLTAKTTESKIGTVKSACDACDGATSYRKQASVKIAGLFWGCTCDEMVNLTGPVSENEGVFFWNASKKAAFYDQDAGAYAEIDFKWDILNRIGQKAADCEGVWTLNVADFELVGAGFGKVAGCDDAAYVKSMNGNFAGTYIAGNGCKRCEEATASAWALCDCGEADARTAAYGNWTLKYNASVTKKFRDSSDWSWYKFPGDTLEAIQELISGKPAPTPTPAELAKKNYEAAKKALTGLQAQYAELKANMAAPEKSEKGKELTAEKTAAEAVAKVAGEKLDDAKTEKDKASEAAKDIANGALTDYFNATTNKVAVKAALDKELANDTPDPAKVADLKVELNQAESGELETKDAYDKAIAETPALTASDKTALANYLDALNAKAAADKDVKDAEEALEGWKADGLTKEMKKIGGDDGKGGEIGIAQAKLEYAQMACITAGVICE